MDRDDPGQRTIRFSQGCGAMKDGVSKILGKAITAVVVGESDKNPHNQVFLVFDDGTKFEFWGADLSCASGLDQGGVEEARAYIEGIGGRVVRTYQSNSE